MKKVLVIEKDTVTARRMNALWEVAGYEGRVATDLSRAAFEACQWKPDLITLNMDGLEMEGREVLLQLQSRPQTSRIPVVLFSNKQKTAIPEALRLGVRTVVEKSIRFDELLEKTPGFSPVTTP
ncbi:MAG: response regulator [Elusimicrobia bacterium]|jgi:CheY-like chemotaxis protein|nr:response regulator [Elusimicrobiota bacterium]